MEKSVSNKNRIFSEYEVGKIKNWAESLVKNWHDNVKPDYIFLTETSSIPHGWVLKEAWRKAYSDEPLPKFYRINPEAPLVKNYQRNQNLKAAENYLATRITNKKPRIIVFDEGHENINSIVKMNGVSKKPDYESEVFDYDKFTTIQKIFGKLTGRTKRPESIPIRKSVERAGDFLYKVLEDLHIDASIWLSRESSQDEVSGFTSGRDYVLERASGDFYSHNSLRPTQKGNARYRSGLTISNPYHKGLLDEDIVGIITKDSKQRERSNDFIKELKVIGEEAGEELHAKLRKKKKLEQIVSGVLAISGISLSFFFLGTSFTGRIVDEGASNNFYGFVGIILFLIGIFGAFLSLKKRK